jgi:hypothetical protein
MGRHLRPGDSCPWCDEELDHRPRSILTLYLRQSQLQCSNCDFVARKRKAYADKPVEFPQTRNSMQ